MGRKKIGEADHSRDGRSATSCQARVGPSAWGRCLNCCLSGKLLVGNHAGPKSQILTCGMANLVCSSLTATNNYRFSLHCEGLNLLRVPRRRPYWNPSFPFLSAGWPLLLALPPFFSFSFGLSLFLWFFFDLIPSLDSPKVRNCPSPAARQFFFYFYFPSPCSFTLWLLTTNDKRQRLFLHRVRTIDSHEVAAKFCGRIVHNLCWGVAFVCSLDLLPW